MALQAPHPLMWKGRRSYPHWFGFTKRTVESCYCLSLHRSELRTRRPQGQNHSVQSGADEKWKTTHWGPSSSERCTDVVFHIFHCSFCNTKPLVIWTSSFPCQWAKRLKRLLVNTNTNSVISKERGLNFGFRCLLFPIFLHFELQSTAPPPKPNTAWVIKAGLFT